MWLPGACGGRKRVGPPVFPATATHSQASIGYGEIVAFEFTFTNDNEEPWFIDRVEGLQGRRWEMAGPTRLEHHPLEEKDGRLVPAADGSAQRKVLVKRGLLLPGQSMTFLVDYRILTARERIVLSVTPTSRDDLIGAVWLPAPGGTGFVKADGKRLDEFAKRSFPAVASEETGLDRAVLVPLEWRRHEPVLVKAEARIPAPPAPFAPKERIRDDMLWTFSLSLGGYVIRRNSSNFELQRAEEVTPIPPLPFELIDDVDGGRPVTVLDEDRAVRGITREDFRAFLDRVFEKDLYITYSDEPDRAPFMVKGW